MSWADFYARRDAIDAALAYARRHQGEDLPFEELDDVKAVFADREELALALQYRWSQAVQGRVTVALSDAEHAEEIDHVEAVATAWRKAATANPELRALLDGYPGGPGFRAAVRAEQRMIALAAGLAAASEPATETAAVGAAFIALIRNTPTQPTRSTNPVEQLLRRLVASG